MIQFVVRHTVRRTALALVLASAAMTAPTFSQAQAKSAPASGGGASSNSTTGTEPCPRGLACTAGFQTDSTASTGSTTMQVILVLLGLS